MRFLLDTNVLSDFVRGDAEVSRRFKGARPDDLAICTITVMEIDYGLALNAARARRIAPLLATILESIHVLPFSRADARASGVVRAALRKRGRPIGPYDALIAGCALARGLTLVSANTGEFRRVDGLTLDDWRLRA